LLEDRLFTRLKGTKRKPPTRDHYRERVKRWARIADPRAFSTHSLRRAKTAYIYETRGDQRIAWSEVGLRHQRLLQCRQKKALAIAREFDI
jgi:integrase